MPNGEIGTFLIYSSLVQAQLVLSFPYVSINTPFLVTSRDGLKRDFSFTSETVEVRFQSR